MSDPAPELLAAWGEATRAWWALMAGSWTAADAVVRALLEASYQEASISRVNEVDFDHPAATAVGQLTCTSLTRIGPGPNPTTIQPAKGAIGVARQGPAGAAPGTARATLTVSPAGAAAGDYVATIRDTGTTPHRDIGRVVVFVLPT